MLKTFLRNSRVRLFSACSLFTILALAAAIPMSASKGSEVRLRTALTGGAIGGQVPGGHAEFRAEAAKNRSKLEVEVEHVNLPAGTMLAVTFLHPGGANVTLGTITLNSFGAGELELESEDGDTVPAVQKGDTITVLNGATPIETGVF